MPPLHIFHSSYQQCFQPTLGPCVISWCHPHAIRWCIVIHIYICWWHTFHMVSVQNTNTSMDMWVPSIIINPPRDEYIEPFKVSYKLLVYYFHTQRKFHIFGSTWSSSTLSGPFSRAHIVYSISNFMNEPGILRVATYLFYLASKTQDRSMDYVVILGDIVSSFVLYTLCFLISVHMWTLIFMHWFCFRNIRYSMDYLFSSLVIKFRFSGSPTSHMYSCFIYCRTDL